MKVSRFGRYALSSCVAVATLAGCGGSQLPIGAPGTMPQSHAIARRAERGGSWMLRDATSQALLYVSDNRTVTVYSYPRGRLEGTLRGFYISSGECVDPKGHVFITNFGTSQIFEYAHGATKRQA